MNDLFMLEYYHLLNSLLFLILIYKLVYLFTDKKTFLNIEFTFYFKNNDTIL